MCNVYTKEIHITITTLATFECCASDVAGPHALETNGTYVYVVQPPKRDNLKCIKS